MRRDFNAGGGTGFSGNGAVWDVAVDEQIMRIVGARKGELDRFVAGVEEHQHNVRLPSLALGDGGIRSL